MHSTSFFLFLHPKSNLLATNKPQRIFLQRNCKFIHVISFLSCFSDQCHHYLLQGVWPGSVADFLLHSCLNCVINSLPEKEREISTIFIGSYHCPTETLQGLSPQMTHYFDLQGPKCPLLGYLSNLMSCYFFLPPSSTHVKLFTTHFICHCFFFWPGILYVLGSLNLYPPSPFV